MQGDLFGDLPSSLPEGFRYRRDAVPQDMQDELLREIPKLLFKAFDFHGFEGKRRVVSFGWKYDFDTAAVRKADDLPSFLLPLRELSAEFAGLSSDRLQQALISEYGIGAPIGWHRDKAVFGVVVGISLLSPCTFRLRRRIDDSWERVSIIVEPGSIYLLSGIARTVWEHSIPPVDRLRYSITFRELIGKI
ncbi:alpha-ketoglutarate-dependent dioxygenase AlkB (plasmid) [Ensifer adhaerens]|uniref:alpha-ketoglutarate-dependent dioxygenase AlkB n=1 Tax=Ensifer adhaerens TaxID=106592 RepID=UPI001CBD8422|nr:alpha-ketoglutarate-dependent dioxygenase AlkB [Ensifer adhaerens]MBZ7927284.1 alpha-ketoglutarate-dependent dioxygenase AlkB [Ensifer adhaerens]UAX98299.1 alpha-ketoglutarate-dependent dioxygenase AlkB [Ensifer adhaerens]UAY05682.1 alpha-ketoglutarate-dependent dioxygenase AlkB [Ensifer adhaerens]UAY13060.1 alpha-ketoglutarate-dependent dioxygenase AlkB [Ensifer adhaerens]